MAQKASTFDKFINQAYGWGAAIVIIGALFKILHFELGPLTGGVMLTVGLLCEAVIFAISAFEPVKPKYDWTLAYPELNENTSLARRNARNNAEIEEAEVSLSKKLDNLLKEAKIDGDLMQSLSNSIRSFEGAAKNIAPTAEAVSSQKKYSQEMNLAAIQMESLNNLYKMQLESSNRQADANRAIADNAQRLQMEMQSLTENISHLNAVYGGMLSAMRPTQK